MSQQPTLAEFLTQADVKAAQETIRGKLMDLSVILTDPEIQEKAIRFLLLAEEEGVAALTPLVGREQATTEWRKRTPENQLSILSRQGGERLNEVVMFLKLLGQAPPRIHFVLEEAMKVVRIATQTSRDLNLGTLLQTLEQKLMVQQVSSPKQVNGDEIIRARVPQNQGGYQPILYRANPNSVIGQAVWPFLLEAEQRALESREKRQAQVRARQEEAKSLAEKADSNLSLSMVAQGLAGGTYFLSLPGERGALLSFKILEGGATARVEIPETNYGLIWKPILISLPGFAPLRGRWPHESYKIALIQELQNEEIAKRRQAVVDAATFPIPWRDQGLTRVLQGEEGTVAIWERHFRWNWGSREEQGFFAIALKREGKKLIIEKVVSDLPSFPMDLVGTTLPPISLVEERDGSPTAHYNEHLSISEDMPEKTYRAYLMLRMVIIRRLTGERRAIS
ncbi:hypothetical protein KKB68_02700 [Patescibacteria group bacterium]|nr:hypothetical protein [Patescibacteria group bacterium]